MRQGGNGTVEMVKTVSVVLGVLVALTVLLGLFIRFGKILANSELTRTKVDAVLEEFQAHCKDSSVHVNSQLEALKGKMDEDFRQDVKKKLDELLRSK